MSSPVKKVRWIIAILLVSAWLAPAIDYSVSYFDEEAVELSIEETEAELPGHLQQIQDKVITFTGIVGFIHQYYK